MIRVLPSLVNLLTLLNKTQTGMLIDIPAYRKKKFSKFCYIHRIVL